MCSHGTGRLVQGFRYGARLLARNPLFALTAALSLAIGIGADTTIFTLANALLFRAPAGIEQPERLVDVVAKQGALNNISYPNYVDIRRRATTLDPFVFKPVAEAISLGSTTGAERIFANYVSTNYFSVLGARPAVGRLFVPSDSEEPGASPIVVLSYEFWTRHFNKETSIIGNTLQLNGHAFTVTGVAPEGFQGTNIVGNDVWMPIGMVAAMQNPVMVNNRGMGWLVMGGRLKPGITRSQAGAELDAIVGALMLEYPNENQDKAVRVMASTVIPGEIIPAVSGFLSLLLGIVSLVLIIACANVAGVLLARAAARRREIAVRLAIGAGHRRLMRQLLAETLILFAPAAVGGLLIARGMTSLLVSLLPILPVPVELSLGLDARIIAFTLGLSLLASLFCGLAPALQASKADVVKALKDDAGVPRARTRLRSTFVVVQVSVSIVVIVAAGLFVRALQKAASIGSGL